MSDINTYILGARPRYKVKSSVVVIDLLGGGQAYIYKGGILPSTSSDQQIQHLLELKLIEQVSNPTEAGNQ